MRYVGYSATGPSSVLQLAERPDPEPGPGEVRVRLVVAGVNPTDWKSRSGLTSGPDLPFPEITPGQDGAGVVDALGEGVFGLAVGDRVWVYLAQHGRPGGTAAELTVQPADRVVRLGEASYDVGASLGVPAMTAHRALTVHEDGPDRLAPGRLDGRIVLVTGGAGAVGHAAIQLARWAGATVVTTVSSHAKGRLASAAGAHHVVDYTTGDPGAAIRGLAPDGVDLVVEVALIQNVALLGQVLRTRGSVAAYANTGGTDASLPVRSFMTLNARIQLILLYTVGESALRTAAEDVAAAAAAGVLGVGEEHGLPLVRFPLTETAAAHDAVEAGTVGKVLIDL